MRKARVRLPSANRSKHFGIRSQDTVSVGARSYRRNNQSGYVLNSKYQSQKLDHVTSDVCSFLIPVPCIHQAVL
jgi:hypothetical protein